MHAGAAVDDERLPGDEVAVGRGEEGDRADQILGRLHPSQARASAAAVRIFTMPSSGFSSLSVLPGATQLTQMLSSPTSCASVFVKPRMPALEVT